MTSDAKTELPGSSRILLAGRPVSPGVVSGRVRVVDSPGALGQVRPGDILVIPNGHPNYAIALARAAGLICEVGGALAHICIVALEMGVPCITQAHNAIELLRDVGEVCLDANQGVVYAQE